SRRRHTRLQGDWSSDVCSSDLRATAQTKAISATLPATAHSGSDTVKSRAVAHSPMRSSISGALQRQVWLRKAPVATLLGSRNFRSEERRVGKECRERWWPCY